MPTPCPAGAPALVRPHLPGGQPDASLLPCSTDEMDDDENMPSVRDSRPRHQDEFPMGTTYLGEVLVVRTATTFRRASANEVGPRGTQAPASINYNQPHQTFDCLYAAVTQVIADCGACCRADIALIPAFSRYTTFQIERALLTAAHHGLIKRVGSIAANHPDAPANRDDPDLEVPGIYELDPLGFIDRTNPDATVERAMHTRTSLELCWAAPQPLATR